ncbi:MAG TPA: universal stress protein [Xanthomonadales bacterium]|nr:universal stress protein [Xanthomonadales bacterium]
MATKKTYVVAVREPESGRIALQRAGLLSAPGDRIVLAHVPTAALLSLLGAGEMRRAAPDLSLADATRVEWLDELAAAATAGTRAVDAIVLEGRPAPAICNLARRLDAAAIVVGTHRAGNVREFVLGSTALRILRQAPCPVLVARSASTASYRNVLAAAATDPVGRRVVTTAHRLFPDAAMTVLSVYRVGGEGQMRAHGVPEAQIADMREEARRDALHRLEWLHAFAPGAKLDLREGFAATGILEAVAAHSPDVLVISRHRGSAADEHVLGSVTQFALYHADCDLLLVP